MSSEASTHQLVGYVTKMFPTFGYINNEIFFQRKCVIGPMVEVGDNVATSAVYQPNMPIKWSAEKVWKVQDSSRSRPKDETEGKKTWVGNSPRAKSPGRDTREGLRASRDNKPQPLSDRKRHDISPIKRSGSSGRVSVDRPDIKRRKLSPVGSIHSRSSPRRSDMSLQKLPVLKCLLNTKQLVIPEVLTRFPGVSAPVDLYRIICNWQDSFALLKPFSPERSTVFQVFGKVNDSIPAVTRPKAETGFYVNVLLLAMPSMLTLQDKTTIRAESTDRDKPALRKYIKLLAVSKTNERFKSIGGPWNPDLDGEDPVCNSQALINAAIRICKEQIGLDLSFCTQWHRFLEFRYSRTEGSTARPASVLFPGSQLWGRSFPEAPNSKSTTPSKPYHRIVVYFVPDIWSLMPSTSDWTNVKKAMEQALSQKVPRTFPMSEAEIKRFSEASSIVTSTQPSPTKASDTTNEGQVTTISAEDSLKNATTTPKSDQVAVVLGVNSKEGADDGLQSPIQTSVGDKSTSSQEGPALNKTPIKVQDEMNLPAMKVSELREQLKMRNLPSDGIKAQLLSRLKSALEKEAEQARKEEEERKKKEKEMQEALAAKEEEDKKRECLKPTSEPPVTPKCEPGITLRNYPSIVIQQRLTTDYALQTVTLDSILDSKSEFMDARSYELIVCVHNLLDMIRRDAIFTFFRALVTAGDRGIQAKSQHKSATETGADGKGDRKDQKEAVKLQTIDLPLLCACTFLDSTNKNYFYTEEVEELITSLGLPVSRYQVRSLVMKVAEGHRIYYRALTDAELSPSGLKNISPLSEIDDDEYLLELIRGGDAILDEQKDLAMPTVSVLVLRVPDSKNVPDSSTSQLYSPNSDVTVGQQITQLQSDCSKLRRQLKCKSDEIDRLRIMADQIPSLNEKLAATNTAVEELRRRLRGEYERMHSAYRLIEQQANNLESSRTALRQAANRLRGREDSTSTPTKKTTTEQKDKPEQPERKGTVEKSTPNTVVKPKGQSKETDEPDAYPVKMNLDKPVEEKTSYEGTVENNLMDVSVSVTPMKSPEMVNGIEEGKKSEATPQPSTDTSVPTPVAATE